jgi:prefoldin subunit 5
MADCTYNSDNDEDEKKKEEKNEKKMTFQKNKGGGYVVMWDSDASSEDDDSSDDDKKSKNKALASTTINNKPFIFDILSTCLMAKPTKVKYDESDDDACDSDDCRSDDEEEDSNEALMDMLENAHTCVEMKRKECKELRKELKALKRSFNELNASHESLREDHEELGNAHTKLERAHSSLLKQVKKEKAKKEQVIVSCDVGLTCDILDESFYKLIVVASTNPSCSTTTSSSTSSDGFTCDVSLIVENKTLKKEINELTRALGNAYGEDACLLKCLGSQMFSLNKEGLDYTPKKGKQVGHIEQYYKTNKNKQPNVSSIRLHSCYMFLKGANSVKAKFIGTPIVGPKKTIWVPKNLVTNL